MCYRVCTFPNFHIVVSIKLKVNGVVMNKILGENILPVAMKDRYANFMSLFWLWAGGNILLATFMVGSYYSEGIGFWPTIIVSITGNLAAYTLCAVSSQRASKYGVDEMISLRPTFGIRGSYFGAFVLVFINFGWIGLLSAMTGTASQSAAEVIFYKGFTFAGDYSIYALGGGIFIPLLLIMINPKNGLYLSRITVPVLSAFSLYVLYTILSNDVYFDRAVNFEATGDVGWAFALETCVVFAVAWQPYLGAWNKFADSQRSAYWSTFWGLVIIAILFSTIGGIATLVTGEIDPAVWTVELGLGVPALLIVILGTITTCSLLLYAGIMGFLSVFPSVSYRMAAILLALPSIMFVYATSLHEMFGIILLFVGLLAGPYWAVTMADFFFLRNEKYDVEACYDQKGKYSYFHGVNLIAVASVIIGMVVWLYLGGWLSGLEALTFDTGIVWFEYLSATLPAMAVSAGVYVIAIKFVFANSATVAKAYPGLSAEPKLKSTRVLS